MISYSLNSFLLVLVLSIPYDTNLDRLAPYQFFFHPRLFLRSNTSHQAWPVIFRKNGSISIRSLSSSFFAYTTKVKTMKDKDINMTLTIADILLPPTILDHVDACDVPCMPRLDSASFVIVLLPAFTNALRRA